TAQLGDHRGDRRGGPLRAGGRGGTPQFLDDAATLVDDPGSYLGASDINPDRQAHAGILPEIPAAGGHPRPMPPVRPGLPPPPRAAGARRAAAAPRALGAGPGPPGRVAGPGPPAPGAGPAPRGPGAGASPPGPGAGACPPGPGAGACPPGPGAASAPAPAAG